MTLCWKLLLLRGRGTCLDRKMTPSATFGYLHQWRSARELDEVAYLDFELECWCKEFFEL